MTYTLDQTSLRAYAAGMFGLELRRAMKARKIGSRALAQDSGVGRTAICHYLKGELLPKVAVADTFAATLLWPKLAESIRMARTVICHTCGEEFISDSSGTARYCSPACQQVKVKKRIGVTVEHRADVAERRMEELAGELWAHQNSVREFCKACEPGGVCFNFRCALRPVSPLPLAGVEDAAFPATVTRRGNGWVRNREARLGAQSLRLRRMWKDPARRLRQGERARDWWANLSPEEREIQIHKIRTGRRKAVK